MGSGGDGRCRSRDPSGTKGMGDMGLGLLWGTARMGWTVLLQGWGPVSPFPCRSCGSVVLGAHAGSPCQQLACSHGQALPVQLLPEPPALAARTDPAPSTCVVQIPILVTSECCRVKIPQKTGEGAAGSMQGAWAGEEQAALAHRGSGQAAWLPALRLCHAVPAVPEPTCLPQHPARGQGHSAPCRRAVGTQGTSIPAATSIPLHPWTGAPCALPARPWKGTGCAHPPFRITVACKEGYPG